MDATTIRRCRYGPHTVTARSSREDGGTRRGASDRLALLRVQSTEYQVDRCGHLQARTRKKRTTFEAIRCDTVATATDTELLVVASSSSSSSNSDSGTLYCAPLLCPPCVSRNKSSNPRNILQKFTPKRKERKTSARYTIVHKMQCDPSLFSQPSLSNTMIFFF